jgi:uncharacterized protein (TIGR02118 family)
MIKLVFCVRRHPSMSLEQFKRYWSGRHAPLVVKYAAALNIRRYVQAHTVEHDLNGLMARARGLREQPYDGVGEVWLESVEDLYAATATEAGRAAYQELLADEAKFIDFERSAIWIAKELEFV